MPELPEVEALAHHLRENAVYRPVARVDVAGMSVLKTFDPPVSALVRAGRHRRGPVREVPGRRVRRPAGRAAAPDHPPVPGRLAALARARRPPPRRSPGAGRWSCACTSTRSAARASTSPRPARRSACRCTWWPTRRRSPASPGSARTRWRCPRDELAELLAGRTERIKTLIVDQQTIAGIGNAYSDEILHTAQLSPYAVAGRLRPEQVDDLHAAMTAVLADAVERSVGQGAATLKGEKRSGLRVHARTGLPCPVCGDTVREVSFADRSFQYCPGCQTGGRPLADRRLSRLVR